MTNPKPQIVLASSSPFRKELLARLMIPFETYSPDIDETAHKGETPVQLVERLAIEKAKAVAEQFTDALIIGSDQVAIHPSPEGDQIVGKPHTHERAVEQLRTASGQQIKLYTGLALLNSNTGDVQSEVIPYIVHFKNLTEEVIEAYLRKEEPYNCTGSVRSEGLGISLLERFEGEDPNTLIGLPLIRLISMLEKEDYPLLD